MKHFLYIVGISSLIACSGSPDKQFPRYSNFPETEATIAINVKSDDPIIEFKI